MKGFFKILFWIFEFSNKISNAKQRWKRQGPAGKIISMLLILLLGSVGLVITYFTFKLAQNLSTINPIAHAVYIFAIILVGIIALGFVIAEYELLFINAIAAFASRAKKEKKPAASQTEEISADTTEINTTTNEGTTVIDTNADKPKTSRAFDTTMGTLYLILLIGFTAAIFFAAAFAFQK